MQCVVKCNTLCQHIQDQWQMNGEQVPFQNTQPNLFISTQATKERKIERLSPWWQPCVFSKYSTKFIYFHTGRKRTEIWQAFTWMTTKCLFKILDKIYLFPHRSQKKRKLESFLKHSTKDIYESTILVNKSRIKNCFKWNTRKGLKVQVIFWTMVVIFSFMEVTICMWVNTIYATFLSHASRAACRGWLRIGCWIGAATLRTSCSQFLFFQHQTLFVPKFHPLPLLSGLRGKPSMCHNWSSSSNKIFTRPTPQTH